MENEILVKHSIPIAVLKLIGSITVIIIGLRYMKSSLISMQVIFFVLACFGIYVFTESARRLTSMRTFLKINQDGVEVFYAMTVWRSWIKLKVFINWHDIEKLEVREHFLSCDIYVHMRQPNDQMLGGVTIRIKDSEFSSDHIYNLLQEKVKDTKIRL